MFTALDQQLERFSPRLRDDLGLTPKDSKRTATAMATDLRALTTLDAIALEDEVGFLPRYEELLAFQGFMDATRPLEHSPVVARARVLIQNYVCFVYMKEAWLERLRDTAPVGSVLRKCATYLTTGSVRSFRNAVAHARWRYKSDYSGIDYWDRASRDRTAPLRKFGVDQLQLDFWQSLIRATCYVTAEVLRDDSRQDSSESEA